MAVTLNANSSTGFIATSDTSGVLQLQTGGTTAVTVDASQNVALAGSLSTTGSFTTTGGSNVQTSWTLREAGTRSLVLKNPTSTLTASVGTGTNHDLSLEGNLVYIQTGSFGARSIVGTFDASGGFKTLNTIGVGNATPSTSGAGITFPATQSASTDVNTLDDYEEGTWTPVLNFGSSAGVSSYALQNGTYTKVGNTVTVRCYIAIITKSAATGVAQLAGLPFVTKSGSGQYQSGLVYMSSQSYTGAPMCYLDPSASVVNLGQTNGSTGFVSIFNTNFVNTGDFIFQATYFTN
jgi:hypothetical protein